MKFILGTKQGMTQVFDEQGIVHPATVLIVPPMTVTQVKSVEKEGYASAVLGYGSAKEKHLSKPVRGKMGGALYRGLKEFRPKKSRGETLEEMESGKVFDVSVFEEGDTIAVSAISKGKGFQGVVKRHGFHGGPRTHGQKHSEREPGSIGGGGRAGGRVAKGMRMAGRMGGDRITVKNLKVLQIDKEKNILVVSGAVPGRRGALVEVRGI
ncbi:MAG TPA: 50S ribosomal protein L3 [Candidatus Paceibacterota bacterium]